MDSSNEPDVRTLLGRFASGVTVLTACDSSGTCYGMTASAVCSVSIDPPLLLTCVGREARLHGALSKGAAFGVNVLAADQQDLSEHFAAKLDDPFHGVPLKPADHGPPLIAGALAHIVCTVWDRVEAGDHTVFYGRIEHGETSDGNPLLHFRGCYATLRDPENDTATHGRRDPPN